MTLEPNNRVHSEMKEDNLLLCLTGKEVDRAISIFLYKLSLQDKTIWLIEVDPTFK